MDKYGLLVNFFLGLVNWFLTGIHAQTFPDSCATYPSSWTATGNTAPKDWYCETTALTAYTFTLSSLVVKNEDIGWDTGTEKFKIEFTTAPTYTATNSCPVVEAPGDCSEVVLSLSSTQAASTLNGSPLTINGDNFYGWLEWKCQADAGRVIKYAFPINKVDDAESSFISQAAAANLKTAYENTNPNEGKFDGVTALQDDIKANWDFFADVDENAGVYFEINYDGEMYKVFSNVTLKLSEARYAEIFGVDGNGAPVADGSSGTVAGFTPAAPSCQKIFKPNTGFVNQTCTECAEKCGAMQIAPKMILSLLTILLFQCFRY